MPNNTLQVCRHFFPGHVASQAVLFSSLLVTYLSLDFDALLIKESKRQSCSRTPMIQSPFIQ